MSIQRIKELVNILNKLSDAYYNKNGSPVSDPVYDRLYNELECLEKEHRMVLSNSPTQSVGYYPISELEEVNHPIPLLSLDKTKKISKLVSFIGKHPTLLMLKMDGLTVKLTYDDGKLKEAATRGDGEIGEKITHNIPAFSNVPLSIPLEKKLVLVGEAFIHMDDFEDLKETIYDSNGEKYKSARNLASGSVRSKNPANCKERRVHFLPFQVLQGMEDEDSRSAKLEKLENMGFGGCPYFMIIEDTNDTEYLELCIAKLKETAESLQIPIDGIVAVYDSFAYAKSCGRTGKYYKDGIAYKFEDNLYDTILRKIEWTPTRSGEIAPVGVFDSVEIEGGTVSRATLHNLTNIKALGLAPGCRIQVTRRNMIIPSIEKNLDRELYTNTVPPLCPCCKAETRIVERRGSNGKIVETVRCDNPNCETQLIRKFEHFASKKAMDIEGLSRATLEQFMALGCLQTYQDIYHLDQYRGKIIRMNGFGERSFDRLWKAIEASRQTSFVRYLVSMDIPMVGRTKSRLFNDAFRGNLDAFEEAALGGYDFTELKDCGEVINQNIHTWFANEDNLSLWRSLQSEMHFEEYKENVMESNENNPFYGKTIVATGKLEHFTRDTIHEQIMEIGAIPVKTVTQKIDFLIVGDKAGSKLDKAKHLGIPILTEGEFLSKIG